LTSDLLTIRDSRRCSSSFRALKKRLRNSRA
jgi:hypothetical protein